MSQHDDEEDDIFQQYEDMTLDMLTPQNTDAFRYCPICDSIVGGDYTTHLIVNHPNTFVVMSSIFMNDTDVRNMYNNLISYAIDNAIDNMDYESLQQLCDSIGYHKVGVENIEEVIHTKSIEEIEPEQACAICLETFLPREEEEGDEGYGDEEGDEDDENEIPTENKKEVVEIRACKHLFCRSCLEVWLKENKTCPLCKVEVEADGEGNAS